MYGFGQFMPGTRQTTRALSREVPRLEALPVPVVAYGRDLAPGDVLPPHQHTRAQLVYAVSGVMQVTTPAAAYLVPPQRALWVPGGIEHGIEARGAVAMRTLYVEPGAHPALPVEVRVLRITPLLRELVVEAVAAGPEYSSNNWVYFTYAKPVQDEAATTLARAKIVGTRLAQWQDLLVTDSARSSGRPVTDFFCLSV